MDRQAQSTNSIHRIDSIQRIGTVTQHQVNTAAIQSYGENEEAAMAVKKAPMAVSFILQRVQSYVKAEPNSQYPCE
jgi:hypothetical protein